MRCSSNLPSFNPELGVLSGWKYRTIQTLHETIQRRREETSMTIHDIIHLMHASSLSAHSHEDEEDLLYFQILFRSCPLSYIKFGSLLLFTSQYGNFNAYAWLKLECFIWCLHFEVKCNCTQQTSNQDRGWGVNQKRMMWWYFSFLDDYLIMFKQHRVWLKFTGLDRCITFGVASM